MELRGRPGKVQSPAKEAVGWRSSLARLFAAHSGASENELGNAGRRAARAALVGQLEREKRAEVHRYVPVILATERRQLAAVSLSDVMQDRRSSLGASLMGFLRHEKASESLLFWLACQDFSRAFEVSAPRANLACARSTLAMAPRFLLSSSNGTLALTAAELDEGLVGPQTFESLATAARREIQEVQLPRFVQTLFPVVAADFDRLEEVYLCGAWDLLEARGHFLDLIEPERLAIEVLHRKSSLV